MNPSDPSQDPNNINPNQEVSPQDPVEVQPPAMQPDSQPPIAPVQPPQFDAQPIQPQPVQDQFNQMPQQPADQSNTTPTPKPKKNFLIIGLAAAGGVLIIGGVVLTLFLTGILGGNKHRASLIQKLRKIDSVGSDITLTCGEVRSIKDGTDFITLAKENNAQVRKEFEQMGALLTMMTPYIDAAIQGAKDSCQGKSDDAEADLNAAGGSDSGDTSGNKSGIKIGMTKGEVEKIIGGTLNCANSYGMSGDLTGESCNYGDGNDAISVDFDLNGKVSYIW